MYCEGTIWTAVAHIITGVIGSGVLSLAWSMAQLGWIAGPFFMVLFAVITLVSSILVSDCYRSPDPEFGPIRNSSFTDAVKLNLGKRSLQFVDYKISDLDDKRLVILYYRREECLDMWGAYEYKLLWDWSCLCHYFC